MTIFCEKHGEVSMGNHWDEVVCPLCIDEEIPLDQLPDVHIVDLGPEEPND